MTTQKPLKVEVTEQTRRTVKPGPPIKDKFRFKPILFPGLEANVTTLFWDTVSKTLNLHIKEDGNLTCYQWLNYLDQKAHELEKSPFVNMEANGAHLFLHDIYDNEVGEFRFKNLSLKAHSANFFSGSTPSSDRELLHNIILNYQYLEMLQPGDKYSQPPSDNVVDEEWLIECA